jgi:hypothetical protein
VRKTAATCLLLAALLGLAGCSVKPFGFAPWVIVLPGGRLEVTIGNTDKRNITENVSKPDTQEKDESKKPGFKPPKMGD